MLKPSETKKFSEKVSVSPNVIEMLYLHFNDRSEFNAFMGSTPPDDFWSAVDKLCPTLSLNLRRIDMEIPTTTKDYFPSHAEPIFFPFYANKFQLEPCLFGKIDTQKLSEIVKTISGWKETKSCFQVGKEQIPKEDLLRIANAFLLGKKPWEFFNSGNLKTIYEDVYSRVVKQPNSSETIEKLRRFEFTNDLLQKKFKKVGKLSVTNEIINGLHKLMMELDQLSFFPPELQVHPLMQQHFDWLQNEMSFPFSRRSPYSLSKEMTLSMSGRLDRSPFQSVSLASFLHSDLDGLAHPLPFSETCISIPHTSTSEFIKLSVEKFVSLPFIAKGFQETSKTSLNILADYIIHEISKIAEAASVIQKQSRSQDNSCVLVAFERGKNW